VTPSSVPARDLARRLLAREASASDDPSARVAAGERLLTRLRRHLGIWFGSDGVEALLRRSIDRAGVSPAVATNSARSASAIEIMVAATRTLSPEEGAEAVETILTAFTELLWRLVGPDMTERLLLQSESRDDSPHSRGQVS
jgi:hypothetical protein